MQQDENASHTSTPRPEREKTLVALSSVGAAIGLTGFKLIVGLMTGSLGILAEAAHSGLDLVAALMTLFAVRIASQPADEDHHYGHGKVENLSAFIEALLLIGTALWIIYEAAGRLLFQQGHIDVSIWAFLVMLTSIVVDITRARALMQAARKHGSQALEADALHFSTDIWSSAVVVIGLGIVALANYLHLPGWLGQADAVAALGVSGIVIWVSTRLIRETLDALLDKAPGELAPKLQRQLRALPNVIEVRRTRIRRAGNKHFMDIVIAAPRTLPFEQTHVLSEVIEEQAIEATRDTSPQSEYDVIVHIEPIASPNESVADQIRYLAELQGIHAHNIHVRKVNGELEVDLDVEVQADMTLREAHTKASHFERIVMEHNALLRRVTTHIEAPDNTIAYRQEVTHANRSLQTDITRIADSIVGPGRTHEVRLYQSQRVAPHTPMQETQSGGTATLTLAPPEALDVTLHLTCEAHTALSQVHTWAEETKRALRRAHPYLDTVTIHTEPPEE
ncbi:cation diffusion facilitator family transporter [Ktedonobacter robiniae]|uniref:Cation transporter n=1 Tax=Ktedonobacter robiniae TaxID=2778365 RepID=A0ABQ3UN80_9CHLR|nr:cation diffusion facilitator family transporter [Ktedonobacter robiniae]GHO54164.1 cation transporter [Ktedonobacter robiniae]